MIFYNENSVKYQISGALFNSAQISPYTPQGSSNPYMMYSVLLYADIKGRHLKVSRKTYISIDVGFSLQLANLSATSGTITVDVLTGSKMTEWDFKLLIQNLQKAKVNFYSNGIIIDTSIRTEDCKIDNGVIRIEALHEDFRIDNKPVVTIPRIAI